jgi:hypothetical protein
MGTALIAITAVLPTPVSFKAFADKRVFVFCLRPLPINVLQSRPIGAKSRKQNICAFIRAEFHQGSMLDTLLGFVRFGSGRYAFVGLLRFGQCQ